MAGPWDAFKAPAAQAPTEKGPWSDFSPDSPEIAPERGGILDALSRGVKNTVTAGQIAATNNPKKLADLVAESARNTPPPSELMTQIATESAPGVQAWKEAKTLGEHVSAGADVGGTLIKNLVTHPTDTAHLVAENLPYSAPGLAASVAGAAAGGATPVPGGALIGGLAGGFAGAYPVEQGSTMQQLIHELAQKNGVDIQDTAAVADLIVKNYPEMLSQSRTKGAGTAGVDAVLTRLTFGLGNIGQKALADEASAVSQALKAGTINAAQALKQVAAIEAKAAAVGTLPNKLARGAAMTLGEMAGESASEAAGQKLAFGEIDPVDVGMEGLLSLPQGAVMAAGGHLTNKALGLKDAPDIEQQIAAMRQQLLDGQPEAAQTGRALLGLPLLPAEKLIVFPDGSTGTQKQFDTYLAGLPEDQRAAALGKMLFSQDAPADVAPDRLALPNLPPETLVVFPDGSTGTRQQMEEYIAGLDPKVRPAVMAILLYGNDAPSRIDDTKALADEWDRFLADEQNHQLTREQEQATKNQANAKAATRLAQLVEEETTQQLEIKAQETSLAGAAAVSQLVSLQAMAEAPLAAEVPAKPEVPPAPPAPKLSSAVTAAAGKKATAAPIQEQTNGEIPAAPANAEVVASSAEATSRELPGGGGVLAPVATGLPARTGGRAEVVTPGVRSAVPAGATGTEGVAPTLVDRQTTDGRTVRVLQSEVDSPRGLLRVHDAAGHPKQNQDGNAELIQREKLIAPKATKPASQPKTAAKPEAAPAKAPASTVKDSLTTAEDQKAANRAKLAETKKRRDEARRPQQPKTLLHFLKQKGGIATGEALDLGGDKANVLNRKLPGLFRANGMSADAAREAMQQGGWLNGVPEDEQLPIARDLIMSALRGGQTVQREDAAVAMLDAIADQQAAEWAAANPDPLPSEDADAIETAVDALAADHDALDAALELAFNSNKGSMTNEEIAEWLGQEPSEAPRGQAADAGPAGTAESRGDEGRREADQGTTEGFELATQTDTDLAAKEARENDAKAADRERIKQESEVGAGLFQLSAPEKPKALVEAENKAKTGDMFSQPDREKPARPYASLDDRDAAIYRMQAKARDAGLEYVDNAIKDAAEFGASEAEIAAAIDQGEEAIGELGNTAYQRSNGLKQGFGPGNNDANIKRGSVSELDQRIDSMLGRGFYELPEATRSAILKIAKVRSVDAFENLDVSARRKAVEQWLALQKPEGNATAPKKAAEDRLRAFEKDAGGGFRTNDTAIAIIKDAATGFTPAAKAEVTRFLKKNTAKQANGDVLLKPDFYDELSDVFTWTRDYLTNAIDRHDEATANQSGDATEKVATTPAERGAEDFMAGRERDVPADLRNLDAIEYNRGYAEAKGEAEYLAARKGKEVVVLPSEFPLREVDASYSHISHQGASRARSDRDEFVTTVNRLYDEAMQGAETAEQKTAARQAAVDFKNEYLRRLVPVIRVRSQTYSGHIAGRSNLNAKQADARNGALDKALDAFSAWQSGAEPGIKVAVLAARNDDQRTAEQQAKDDKAAKRRESEKKHVAALLNFTKGDGSKFGNYPVARVTMDRDGYPSSVTVEATDLTDNKFDIAKTLFGGDKGKLRALVDEIRAEEAAPAEQPAAEDEQAPRQYATMADIDSAIEELYDGTLSPEDYKAAFRGLMANKEAIVGELNKLTIPQLHERFGKQPYGRPEKKGEIVERAFEAVRNTFGLRRSYGRNSYSMGRGEYERYLADNLAALTKLVEESTAEDLKAFADEIAQTRAARQEKLAGAKDPKTIEDFEIALRLKMAEGAKFAEARMSLTPEQRAEYDRLKGIKSRDERKARADQQKTAVKVAGQTTGGTIVEGKHTKHGYPLWIVQPAERVDGDSFTDLVTNAKRMGGNYVNMRQANMWRTQWGYQFQEQAKAEAFLKLLGGDSTDAKGVIQERRDAFADDKSQSAVERLTEMAERMDEKADESLGRERKANTARRARFAAAAESAANAEKAMAKTMRRIASAIESGGAQFLDRVRQKAQIEYLATTLRTAKSNEIRAKYPTYGEQQKHEGEPATAETADHAVFPQYTMMRSDLANLARRLITLPNMKLLGQRILKVADDTSDAYNAFAKAHLLEVSKFRSEARGGWAEFSTLKDAERSIEVSNLADVAVPLQVKRGEYRIVLSPSEAIRRGIWKGDDKPITLNEETGSEIVEKLGKLNRRLGKRTGMDAPPAAPWQFENAYNDRKRLAGMGIEQPWEFRAALREFAGLKETPQEADKIKQLERAMVGRRNDGLDFFPTSAAVVEQMLEAADLQEGMNVLEPSAGMGHIAEGVRAAGVDPDVVEMASDRRELLEAKGFNVVGSDFLDMNPRGFTYGDVFEHKDGRKGVMRGSGGMGSGRVGFIPEGKTARESEWVDRDDLTGVEKRGSESGYDRILMNPPFSDRRDAEHVRHAYTLLRPGGRLVAIMGEGVFFGQDKKAETFRSWLEEVGGSEERLPEGSFMDPSLPVNTSVNARLVVIDKPLGAAGTDDADLSSRSDEDSRGQIGTGQSVAAVRAEVGAKIGKARLAILERKGLVRIHETTATLPEAGRAYSDIWGWFDGKQTHLVASNLAAGQAAGVFEHEIWHMLLRSLRLSESPLYAKILDRLGKIEQNGAAGKWFTEAEAMIPAEDRGNARRRLNELAAYAIQQYENEPKSLPVLIRRFVQDLIASVRAFFMDTLGWVPDNLTAQDLTALTRRYVKSLADGETGAGPLGAAPQLVSFSRLTDLIKSPALQAFLKVATQPQAFQYGTSRSKDLATVLREVGLDREGSAAIGIAEDGGNNIWVGGRNADGTFRKELNIIGAETRTPYVVIEPEQKQTSGQALYQSVMTWAHNNGKTLKPDSSLTAINRLRRNEAMISSMLRQLTSKHVYPSEWQFVGLLSEAEFKQTLDAFGEERPQGDIKRFAPAVHQKLLALRDQHFGSLESHLTMTPAQDRATFESRLQALIDSSAKLVERRDPNVNNLWVEPSGEMYVRRNGSWERKPVRPDSVVSEELAARRGVGRSSLYRTALAKSASSGFAALGSGSAVPDVGVVTRPEFLAENPGWREALAGDNAGLEGVAGARPFYSRSAAGTASGLPDSGLTVQAVTDRVTDLFQTSKTFGIWHKTVGTQFHKASVDKDFGRVFKIGQKFLQDTSQFAMDAADLAPSLLPKLGSIKDVFKRGPKKADLEAVSKVVFQGTLDNKRYTRDELRAQGLNDKQYKLYREFRASIDKSIDDLFVSEMTRQLRRQFPDLGRRLVGMSGEDANATAIDLLREAMDEQKMMAQDGPTPAAKAKAERAVADIKAQIAQLAKQFNKVQKLKDQAYAPLTRFGQYTVDVVQEGQNGEPERVFFGMYESEREANEVSRKFKTDKAMQVSQGVMSQEDWRMFQGVSPDSLELFADALGADESEVFQKYLKLTLNNRSAMKRLIHRQGIAGFSQDVTRVLATFITSNSRLSARNLNLMPLKEAVEAIPKGKGDVKDEAVKLAGYLTDPKEEAQALRGWMFVHFIGGSVASAITNMTQPLTMTAPYLAQWGAVKAGSAMKYAAAAMGKKSTGNKTLDAALDKAEAEGITAPHEIHQLYAESIRTLGSNVIVRKGLTAWGQAFSLAEAFNRRITFIAAFKMAQQDPALGNPFAFAERAVEETQGIYNKGNRPDWARGSMGATIFTFKQFSISYVEFLKRLPPKQRALALAVLFLAAGLQGWPFAEDVQDLIDTIGQSFGYNTNSKRWMHEFAVRQLGSGLGEFATNGFSAIPGMPLDVQARMGLGNLIPGTSVFKLSEKDKSRDVLEFIGPVGSLFKSGMDSFSAAQQGRFGAAGAALMPVAIRNFIKAGDMVRTGEYRDTFGKKVVDVSGYDAAIKAVGFQPSAVAKESRGVFEQKQSLDMVERVESSIADRWAKGVNDKDPGEVRKARADLAEWNAKNPESRIVIVPRQIAARVKAMRQSRQERFIKSAPPEQRRMVAEDLRGGR